MEDKAESNLGFAFCASERTQCSSGRNSLMASTRSSNRWRESQLHLERIWVHLEYTLLICNSQILQRKTHPRHLTYLF